MPGKDISRVELDLPWLQMTSAGAVGDRSRETSGAARAVVTGVKFAVEGPPGRVGPLAKM